MAFDICDSSRKVFPILLTDETLLDVLYLVPHNSKYQIHLRNPFQCRCVAEVSVDAYIVGDWILDVSESAYIERPSAISKCFTFLQTKLVEEAEEAAVIRKKNGSLTFRQRRVLDCTPLGSGVEARPENGLIKVIYKQELHIQIFLRTLIGKTTVLSMPESSTTILDVKKLIELKEAIPCVYQKLLFGGKRLHDNQTLEECDIHQDSTIHMTLHLRGGARNILDLNHQVIHLEASVSKDDSKLYMSSNVPKGLRLASGATTLQGNSEQTFREVEFKADEDEANYIVSYARLVANMNEDLNKAKNRADLCDIPTALKYVGQSVPSRMPVF